MGKKAGREIIDSNLVLKSYKIGYDIFIYA